MVKKKTIKKKTVKKTPEELEQEEIEKRIGRPPVFNTVKEMREKIEDYFTNCPDTKKLVAGDTIVEVKTLTITGLAYHLGFESRQSFYDYEKKEVFSYTVKRARLFIELEYEKMLHFNNVTGAIFALKNFGWIDKQEFDHTNDGGKFETPPPMVFAGDKGVKK